MKAILELFGDSKTAKIVLAVIFAIAMGLGGYFLGIPETADKADDLIGDGDDANQEAPEDPAPEK